MAFLQFALGGGFWHFVGVVILLSIPFHYTAEVLVALIDWRIKRLALLPAAVRPHDHE